MRGFAFIGIVLLVASTFAGCLDDGDEAGPMSPAADDGSEPSNETAMTAPNATVVEGGPSFDDALEIEPVGLYTANLTGGDHYYRFPVDLGDPINIELRDTLSGGTFPALDNPLRLSFELLSPQGLLVGSPVTNQGDTRIMLEAAPVSGEYRFHVSEEKGGFTGEYTFCFLLPPPAEHPCPDIGYRPQSAAGPLHRTHTTALLIPPTHGDLGNPEGPTALDYLDATVSGIHEWTDVLDDFADDYPQYDYLRQVTVSIEIFDGLQDPADYNIVIAFVETAGSQFRGLHAGGVTGLFGPGSSTSLILLTLFAAAPRSGQVLPDYPTYDDMKAVTQHEFAHAWGLGHTLTWTEEYGPDLMNSPAAFVYGDGDPVGDGGVRNPKQCISTLNIYGLVLRYGHLAGEDEWEGGSYELPDHIPYEWYCSSADNDDASWRSNAEILDPEGMIPG